MEEIFLASTWNRTAQIPEQGTSMWSIRERDVHLVMQPPQLNPSYPPSAGFISWKKNIVEKKSSKEQILAVVNVTLFIWDFNYISLVSVQCFWYYNLNTRNAIFNIMKIKIHFLIIEETKICILQLLEARRLCMFK